MFGCCIGEFGFVRENVVKNNFRVFYVGGYNWRNWRRERRRGRKIRVEGFF